MYLCVCCFLFGREDVCVFGVGDVDLVWWFIFF